LSLQNDNNKDPKDSMSTCARMGLGQCTTHADSPKPLLEM
jgi:hypothetical protein